MWLWFTAVIGLKEFLGEVWGGKEEVVFLLFGQSCLNLNWCTFVVAIVIDRGDISEFSFEFYVANYYYLRFTFFFVSTIGLKVVEDDMFCGCLKSYWTSIARDKLSLLLRDDITYLGESEDYFCTSCLLSYEGP